jgi:hypothetical protein
MLMPLTLALMGMRLRFDEFGFFVFSQLSRSAPGFSGDRLSTWKPVTKASGRDRAWCLFGFRFVACEYIGGSSV